MRAVQGHGKEAEAMKGRIIIDFEGEGITEVVALCKVLTVVKGGRISEAGGMRHFCWGTVFPNGSEVWTRRKKKGQKSDSFRVYKTGSISITSQNVER